MPLLDQYRLAEFHPKVFDCGRTTLPGSIRDAIWRGQSIANDLLKKKS